MTAPTAAPRTTPLSGSTDDRAAIQGVIDAYVEGLMKGDVARLREAFHEQATMCGYLGDHEMVTPIQGLYDFVAGNPSPSVTGEASVMTTTFIDVTRNTATAEVGEQAYMGHDFKTSFQLMKLDGRWWITAKLFDGTARG